MLADLASGRTHSALIVIEDEVNESGNKLLQSFIHNASLRQMQTHVLCFENSVEKWKKFNSDLVHLHDCFSDPLGWNKDHVTDHLQCVYWEKGLVAIVDEITREPEPALVCIDSLTPILFNSGLSQCYKDLHRLLTWSRNEEKKLHQLICIVHRDAVPNKVETLAQLRHIAITVFQMEPSTYANMSGWSTVTLTHRKSGGKVIKQTEEFFVDKDNNLVSKEKKKKKRRKDTSRGGDTVDPCATVQNLTTFKLTLNPQEEKARSQLVLPYTRKNITEETSGGGKVFYEPDAADDWDDEDPDDDLDV